MRLALQVRPDAGITRRCLILLGATLALGGCGFQPLYGHHGGGAGGGEFDADLASVKVGLIPNRLGQQLAISLRDSFNPTGVSVPTRYLLEVGLTTYRNDLGIRADATAVRSEVIVVASYKLTDVNAKKQVISGSTRAVSAFDILNNAYATTVAQEDAGERALEVVADDLRERVAVYIRDHRSAARGA
jgi:LPS-assembly lipoprotein